MIEMLELRAADGHAFHAALAAAAGKPRGGLVVIQEIFGVNAHVRAVAERFASAGYSSLAPALFDRIETSMELDYDQNGVDKGREAVAAIGWDAPLRDVRAAADWLAAQGLAVAVVGFCWGGTLACLCATRLGLPAVSYYGARTVPFLHERPQAPMLLHFGERDELFPLDQIEKVRTAWPSSTIQLYPAGHGFNCEARADFHAESASRAFRHSLAFLERELGA